MNGYRTIAAAALAGALAFTTASAANDQVGTRSFPFLRIGVGARPVAMGEAFSAIAEGADGFEWNPAGIAQLNHPTLSTEYMSYLEDIHAGSVVFAQPVGKNASVGLSVRFFTVRDIQRTTLDNPTGAGLGSFAATDLAFKASAGYRLTKRVFVGASGALISGTIDDMSAFAYSADFGLLVRDAWRRLRLGASVRNLGTMSSGFVSEADPLPSRFGFGAAYPFFDRRLLASFEWGWAVDWDNEFDFGVEWEAVPDFLLRTGYRTHLADLGDQGEGGDLAGLSFGIGVRKLRGYEFDYAYASMADLGGTHRFSFAWVFR